VIVIFGGGYEFRCTGVTGTKKISDYGHGIRVNRNRVMQKRQGQNLKERHNRYQNEFFTELFPDPFGNKPGGYHHPGDQSLRSIHGQAARGKRTKKRSAFTFWPS